MKKLLLVLAFFGLVQFTKGPKEGIQGQVFWLSGNQMPGPGKSIPPQQGVAREIVVYKPVMLQDTEQSDQFFNNIKAELVTKALSKTDGSFKIKLPPGKYSVFTREPKGFFANIIDQDGCLSCVEVRPKKYTWMTITVDYEAAY
jgi:hypothetical protein